MEMKLIGSDYKIDTESDKEKEEKEKEKEENIVGYEKTNCVFY